MASGVGMVGHFLTLSCYQHFRKSKTNLNKSLPQNLEDFAGCGCRASTHLVWLLVGFVPVFYIYLAVEISPASELTRTLLSFGMLNRIHCRNWRNQFKNCVSDFSFLDQTWSWGRKSIVYKPKKFLPEKRRGNGRERILVVKHLSYICEPVREFPVESGCFLFQSVDVCSDCRNQTWYDPEYQSSNHRVVRKKAVDGRNTKNQQIPLFWLVYAFLHLACTKVTKICSLKLNCSRPLGVYWSSLFLLNLREQKGHLNLGSDFLQTEMSAVRIGECGVYSFVDCRAVGSLCRS